MKFTTVTKAQRSFRPRCHCSYSRTARFRLGRIIVRMYRVDIPADPTQEISMDRHHHRRHVRFRPVACHPSGRPLALRHIPAGRPNRENAWAMARCSLPGPGSSARPKDRDAALAVLREAVARGVDHNRHQRLLWPAHHQPADPRGAASLSGRAGDRDPRSARWRGGGCLVDPRGAAGRPRAPPSTTNLRNLGVDVMGRRQTCGTWERVTG